MSKKRRTKEHKIKARVKQQMLSSTSSPVYSLSTAPLQKTPAPSPTIKTPRIQYAYVVRDMRQTLLITSLLLTASVVFYIFVQSRIVSFTIFGY